MSKQIMIDKIGYINNKNGRYILKFLPRYKQGLKALSGFSHLQVIWCRHLSDDSISRSNLLIKKPYIQSADLPQIANTANWCKNWPNNL